MRSRRPPLPRRLAAFLLAALVAGALAAQDDRSAGLFAEARQLPLVSQSLTLWVDGDDAVVELVQLFANDGPGEAQADYWLHLPREATVTGFGFWRDGRFLAAALQEREEARRAHQAAAAEGRPTALAESTDAVHSFSVYPVAEGSLQQVATTLRLPVTRESGRSHLRLPLDTFLGRARVTTSVLARIETPEALSDFGVDGATPEILERDATAVRFAFSTERPVELWWAEELPPLLTRAEAVPLDDGSFALQLRILLNDSGSSAPRPRETVLLVDTSASMRRRAGALVDLVARVADRSSSPLRIVSVAETWIEVEGADGVEQLARLLDGSAGFRSSEHTLWAAAERFGCSEPSIRCLVVTDPQLDGLDPSPEEPFERLFLADADEIAHFASLLPPDARIHQPDVDPRAHLFGLVDEMVLPVLEVLSIEQPGSPLEPTGSPRLRVAEGGLLRWHARTVSLEPLLLTLAVDGRRLERPVEIELLDPSSRLGASVRRELYRLLLGEWTADYRRERDPGLREQIVSVSLREGIPSAFTSLQVSEEPEGVLPRTGTPAPLLRAVGLLLLLLGGGLALLAGRR